MLFFVGPAGCAFQVLVGEKLGSHGLLHDRVRLWPSTLKAPVVFEGYCFFEVLQPENSLNGTSIFLLRRGRPTSTAESVLLLQPAHSCGPLLQWHWLRFSSPVSLSPLEVQRAPTLYSTHAPIHMFFATHATRPYSRRHCNIDVTAAHSNCPILRHATFQPVDHGGQSR